MSASRAFWLLWMLSAIPIDYWCWRTGRTTLTRTIIWFPALLTIPLMIAGALHIFGCYYRNSGR